MEYCTPATPPWKVSVYDPAGTVKGLPGFEGPPLIERYTGTFRPPPPAMGTTVILAVVLKNAGTPAGRYSRTSPQMVSVLPVALGGTPGTIGSTVGGTTGGTVGGTVPLVSRSSMRSSCSLRVAHETSASAGNASRSGTRQSARRRITVSPPG